MTIAFKHRFTSNAPDVNEAGPIKPSHWNDTHDLLMDTGRLLGRASNNPGAAEEITPDSGHIELVLAGSTPTLRLKDSGATAGVYTNPNITVDAKGRVTLIANGQNPSTYAALAQAAQAAAEAAQAATLAALDDFDDIFLGSKAADPTVDNDGDPLIEGMLYWNSVANDLRVYNGATWQSTAGVGITALVEDTSPQLGGNLDLNGFVITGLQIGTNVQAWDAQLDSLSGASANGVSLVTAANYAAMRALLDLEAGTDFYSLADLVSTANAKGASLIGIEDAGSYFSGATVEAALAAIGARVASLDAAVVLRGSWAANAGTFPGGGTAQAGDSYIVSTAGTVDGVTFSVNDRIIAIADNASTTTYAANWIKADYTDQVLSVDGLTGAVSLSAIYQPLAAALTSWAAIARASGFDTFAATPSSANLRALLSDESGSGAAYFQGGDLGTPSAGVLTNATGLPTAGLVNDAVTYAKMQNISATSRILGRKTAAAGDAEECTLSEVLDFIGSAAQGDVLYRGASGWARLGAGTSGNFLKTQGAGANPIWDAAAGGGGVVLLNSGTVAAAATLDIVLTSYTAYRGLILHLMNFIPATDNVNLYMRFSTDGGATYDAGASDYRYVHYVVEPAGSAIRGSNAATFMELADSVGNGAAEGVNAVVTVHDQTNTAVKTKASWQSAGYKFDDVVRTDSGGAGLRNLAQDTDAIRILFSSGNITSGKWAIYGLA